MSDTTNDSQNAHDKHAAQEFNFTFEGKDAGEALGQGMDALKSVLGGIVGAVKEVVGPEVIRNLEASGWLTQAASCLESVATGLREQGTIPAGKAGELTCFLERVEAEVKGSKFETQLPSLRQRLEDALQLVTQANAFDAAAVSEQQINQLSNAAGYFSAAAASVVLSGAPGNATSESNE